MDRPFRYWIAIGLSLLAIGCGSKPQFGSEMDFIRYPTCSFSGSRDNLDYFWVGGEPRGYVVKDIYLRDAEGKVHNLASLTEETALAWVDRYTRGRDRAVDQGGSGPHKNATFYLFSDRTTLVFHDGRLIDACIQNLPDGPFKGLEVGPTADGEFVKIPAKYEDVVRVFGEPNKEPK